MSHVFISYVREDSAVVDYISHVLRNNGVSVWLDREQISPGQRWKDAIRAAIRDGQYFMFVMSKNSAARDKSYINEELTIAIEELRLRSFDRRWFIPIRISPCDIPDRSIGGGETLRDFQCVDLFGGWNDALSRILRVFGVDDPRLDLGEPLGSGLPSYVQVSGGYFNFAKNSLNLPQLTDITMTITNGWCKRMDEGHVVAYLETRAPFQDMQKLNEQLGFDNFYCVSTDGYVSTNSEDPNRFEMRQTKTIPKGTEARDFASGQYSLVEQDIDIVTEFVARGHLEKDCFLGHFDSQMNFMGFSIDFTGEFVIELMK